MIVPNQYPNEPGFKEEDTSKEAAHSMQPTAPLLRERVVACLSHRPLTADEVAIRINASAFSVRPRISELARMGMISDTGERRANDSGRKAKVWQVNKEKPHG